jgi:hypothetical protein
LGYEFLEFCQNFIVNGYIDGRLVFVVVSEQIWRPCQQELEAVSMTVFRTKVTWSVSINVLGVDISTMLNKSLNNAKVASQARDVERSPEVVGSCVNLSFEFDQDLYQWSMAFACCQME